jgi:SAM-dependent methyltransferase
MATIRKPFQGLINIICFNWHQYLLAILAFWLLAQMEFMFFKLIALVGIVFVLYAIVASLLVSWYVYDATKLYEWPRLPYNKKDELNIANVSAGFDESYASLQEHFPLSTIDQLDFYDEDKHTEVSIKRARKMYPPHPSIKPIQTKQLTYNNEHFDYIFIIFAAHEIRSEAERITFFKELKRCLKPNGSIYVIEHIHDVPNTLAYTMGVFHFLTLNDWLSTFKRSGLQYERQKINLFINQFKLSK